MERDKPREPWATREVRPAQPAEERDSRSFFLQQRLHFVSVSVSETYLRTDIRPATARLPSCLMNLFGKVEQAILGAKEVDFGQRSKAGGAVDFEKWRITFVARRLHLELGRLSLTVVVESPNCVLSHTVRQRASSRCQFLQHKRPS